VWRAHVGPKNISLFTPAGHIYTSFDPNYKTPD